MVAVDDPKEAIRLVEEEGRRFDVLISDYDMPAMRGTTLASRLSHLPCILVSGRDDAITASMPCGNIRKVLIKPYDKRDLSWSLNLLFNREEL